MQNLLHLSLCLEVVASDEIRDIVVIVVIVLLVLALALLLLHGLVTLSELAQRGQRVGAKLVENAGDEFSQLLVFAIAVNGKGVGGYRGVYYKAKMISMC